MTSKGHTVPGIELKLSYGAPAFKAFFLPFTHYLPYIASKDADLAGKNGYPFASVFSAFWMYFSIRSAESCRIF